MSGLLKLLPTLKVKGINVTTKLGYKRIAILNQDLVRHEDVFQKMAYHEEFEVTTWDSLGEGEPFLARIHSIYLHPIFWKLLITLEVLNGRMPRGKYTLEFDEQLVCDDLPEMPNKVDVDEWSKTR